MRWLILVVSTRRTIGSILRRIVCNMTRHSAIGRSIVHVVVLSMPGASLVIVVVIIDILFNGIVAIVLIGFTFVVLFLFGRECL